MKINNEEEIAKLKIKLAAAQRCVVDEADLASADAALEVKVIHNEIRKLQGLPPEYNFIVAPGMGKNGKSE